MRLDDIKVRVENGGGTTGGPTGMARAILREVLKHLRAVVDGAEGQMIDLKGLPLGEGDYRALEESLGRGEVHATVETSGPSEVFETRFPGVWWVRHQSFDGVTVAEHLEITRIPLILATHEEDLRASVHLLLGHLENDDVEPGTG